MNTEFTRGKKTPKQKGAKISGHSRRWTPQKNTNATSNISNVINERRGGRMSNVIYAPADSGYKRSVAEPDPISFE